MRKQKGEGRGNKSLSYLSLKYRKEFLRTVGVERLFYLRLWIHTDFAVYRKFCPWRQRKVHDTVLGFQTGVDPQANSTKLGDTIMLKQTGSVSPEGTRHGPGRMLTPLCLIMWIFELKSSLYKRLKFAVLRMCTDYWNMSGIIVVLQDLLYPSQPHQLKEQENYPKRSLKPSSNCCSLCFNPAISS